MTKFSLFLTDESGATAIEYGMIVALISVLIIGSVTIIGNRLSIAFSTVASRLGG